MAVFFNFTPAPDSTDVVKTTIINFSIDRSNNEDIDTLNVEVNGTGVISGGSFVNGYTGRIFSASSKYVVGIYPKSPFFTNGSTVSVSLRVVNDLGEQTESFSFTIVSTTAVVEPTPASTIPDTVCTSSNKPFFPTTGIGLKVASDTGIGTQVELSWLDAAPYDEDNIILYNIYSSTNRLEVFDGYPDYISEGTVATVGGLNPGDPRYFAVRAAEFNSNYITLSGLRQTGVDLYFYPNSVTDAYMGASDVFILADTTGFPDYGIIKIDDELIRYSSKEYNGFTVVTRGFNDTNVTFHNSGSSIILNNGIEDTNTVIVMSTPTFQKPNYALTWVLGDGYGNDGYRDGYDGYSVRDGYDGYLRYHQQEFDNITTDGTNNDESGDFERFDYCGSWRVNSPASFMQGQCKPSYFGGAQVRIDDDGYRHLVKVPNVRTHMLQREEMLLESTGEPFILLKRMWTGTRCVCFRNRREHPDARCPICFGTGFVAGFRQFINGRRPDSRILVRVDPAADDVNLVDRGGLEPQYEPNAWTMAFPAIKDRDILIRFNPDNTQEFIYEVLDVTRVRAMFTQSGAQKFRLKRLPKTDIIYSYPILRDTKPQPGMLITSENNGPGLKTHSHQFLVRDGMPLNKVTVSTLVSENHNHIIVKGVVYSVLGHTHTI